MLGAERRRRGRRSETSLHDDARRRKTELGDENFVPPRCFQRGRANTLRVPLVAERLGGGVIPSGAQRSRGTPRRNLSVVQRDPSTALGMTSGHPCAVPYSMFALLCS